MPFFLLLCLQVIQQSEWMTTPHLAQKKRAAMAPVRKGVGGAGPALTRHQSIDVPGEVISGFVVLPRPGAVTPTTRSHTAASPSAAAQTTPRQQATGMTPVPALGGGDLSVLPPTNSGTPRFNASAAVPSPAAQTTPRQQTPGVTPVRTLAGDLPPPSTSPSAKQSTPRTASAPDNQRARTNTQPLPSVRPAASLPQVALQSPRGGVPISTSSPPLIAQAHPLPAVLQQPPVTTPPHAPLNAPSHTVNTPSQTNAQFQLSSPSQQPLTNAPAPGALPTQPTGAIQATPQMVPLATQQPPATSPLANAPSNAQSPQTQSLLLLLQQLPLEQHQSSQSQPPHFPPSVPTQSHLPLTSTQPLTHPDPLAIDSVHLPPLPPPREATRSAQQHAHNLSHNTLPPPTSDPLSTCSPISASPSSSSSTLEKRTVTVCDALPPSVDALSSSQAVG